MIITGNLTPNFKLPKATVQNKKIENEKQRIKDKMKYREQREINKEPFKMTLRKLDLKLKYVIQNCSFKLCISTSRWVLFTPFAFF